MTSTNRDHLKFTGRRAQLPFKQGVMLSRLTLSCILFAMPTVVIPTTAGAQDEKATQLRDDQEAVTGRYARFERLLSQMADMMSREDPERAELLRRAISEGRERAITNELELITQALARREFGKAREKQKEVTKNMQQLLTLLQSEDRRSEVEKERERLNNLLKDIRNLAARQKGVRQSTQNARTPSGAAPEQQDTLNRTENVLKDVQSHDNAQSSSENSSSESPDGGDKPDSKGAKSSEKPDGESVESADPKSTDGDGDGGEKNDSQQKQSDEPKQGSSAAKPPESKSGNSGDSQDQSEQSQQAGGQSPSEQSPSSQQPSENSETPGREQLQQARQAMQEAIDQLKRQDRDKAVEKQNEALAELEKARQKLEEQLKQLREEEKEMILAALEARFQRMLAVQTQIYDDTVTLSATPRDEWLNTAVTQCRELAQQQSDLTRECSLTVGLLREDGTSVSILIAVEDIESDMQTASSRLQQTKAGELTLAIQNDVIEALRELIETTQQEMEDMKSEEQKPQKQQSGQQGQSALVELMAEIKVLRSLQIRVNRRTATVDRLINETEQTDRPALESQLRELAIRQNRLTESAMQLAEQMEQSR